MDEVLYALPPLKGKRVLDLCAGTGRESARLAKAYPSMKVCVCVCCEWCGRHMFDCNTYICASECVDEVLYALPPLKGKRVLDLCAGTGRVSARLARAYPSMEACVDICCVPMYTAFVHVCSSP